MPQNALVECIANVSEGRNATTISLIAAAISGQPDCYLLHQDVGADANRTVFTFAGAPDAVFAAAYLIYKVAAERIDMRRHTGAHPRVGAVDVCPFVPIRGLDVNDIIARTQVLGKEVGEKLGVPVFLYEESASAPHRRNLAAIRRGEYEGLADKVRQTDWKPDYGPGYNEAFGATVLGARPFLIAWNINLDVRDPLETARRIAARLRGSGLRGVPGLFPGLKAIGWRLEEYGRCQVSCNVVDPEGVDLAAVFLTAVNIAQELGARVTGSELIGLIPLKYLANAGRAFCWEGGERGRLEAAVSVLGLADLGPFDLEARVLEFALEKQIAEGNK